MCVHTTPHVLAVPCVCPTETVPGASELCPAGSVCLSHTVTLCVTQVSACLTATQNPACVTPRVPQRHVRVTATLPHTPQPCSDSHGALRSAASRHPHATAPCARELGVCVGGQTAAGGSAGRERRLRPCPAGLAGSGPARQRGGRRRRR